MKKVISLLLVMFIGVAGSQIYGQQTNKHKEDKSKKTEVKANDKENHPDSLNLKEGKKPPVKEDKMGQGQDQRVKEGKVKKGKKPPRKQGDSNLTKDDKTNKGKATGKDNYGQQVKEGNMEKKDTLQKKNEQKPEKPVKNTETKK
jgi:hypothetical protein